MEAGYDYLLTRGRLQRRLFNYTGIFVLLLGAVLLATGGAYYGYAARARADLDNLNVSVPGGFADQLAAGVEEAGQGSQRAPESDAAGGLDRQREGADTELLAATSAGRSPSASTTATVACRARAFS